MDEYLCKNRNVGIPRTQLLQGLLVSLGLGDLLDGGLGLSDLGLQGEDPVVTLGGGGLEVQVTGGQLQDELVGTGAGNLGDIGELDDTVGNLQGLILGVEPQSLTGLESVRSGSLGSVVLVQVSPQVGLGNGLLLEVKEASRLEEAVSRGNKSKRVR
jgi:hypothetical protein